MKKRYSTPPVVEHSFARVTCIFIIVLGLVFGLVRCDHAHAAPPSITPNTEAVVVNTPGVVVFPSNRQLVQTFTAATKAASVPVAVGQIGFATDTGSIYRATGTSAGNWTSTGGGGGGTWGSITGTLSDQTDLQTALNLKLASGDIDTSAELRAIITDETGTGALVFAGGNIGAATATTINGVAVASSVGSLINLSSGVEFSVAQSMTITGTGTLNINGGGTLGSAAYLNSGDILTGTVANGNVVTYTEYNGKPGSIFAKSSMWMYSDPIGGSSYWSITDAGGELKFGGVSGSWELSVNTSSITGDRMVTSQDKDGALALLTNHLGEFAATTSAQLLGKITDESGTGVLLTSNGSGAALTALNAANISSGTLAVARGGTGISALGTGVATALGNATNGTGGLVTYGSAGSFTTLATSGAITTTSGTNSATPATAFTLQNTTAAISGTQSASPGLVLEGRGWKSTATAASQAVSWKQFTLPVQGTTTPTSEWRLLSNTNGSDGAHPAIRALSNGPVVITGVSGTAGVLRLNHPDSYIGTGCEFSVGGSGEVYVNSVVSFPNSSGTRVFEFGNSSNYLQLASVGTSQTFHTSSGVLNRRNGTTAQTDRIYSTYDGTNDAYTEFAGGASVFNIKPVASGSATLRPNVFYLTATVLMASGSGSPEGVLTAGIGSTYHRTDGGAATSFYVKESGTGNTGWVAK